MDVFESGVLDLPDFYFTGDDYRRRFEPEAKERFLDLLREHFDSGVCYKGRALRWDTIIEQKMAELGHYLVDQTKRVDFSEPSPTLSRVDCQEFRKRILSLSQSEARGLGIGGSTLHYLREKSRSGKSFKIYRRLRNKFCDKSRVSIERNARMRCGS
jgi:hypothetical protein